MFEQIRKKLESIDKVFNQEKYDSAIASDERKGFAANSDKLDEKLKNAFLIRWCHHNFNFVTHEH